MVAEHLFSQPDRIAVANVVNPKKAKPCENRASRGENDADASKYRLPIRLINRPLWGRPLCLFRQQPIDLAANGRQVVQPQIHDRVAHIGDEVQLL